jgi:hypothetical protein
MVEVPLLQPDVWPVGALRFPCRSLAEGLAPGGILVLEAYTPKQLDFGTGGPPDAHRLVSLETLEKELSGLEVVVAQETEREVHEGRMHTGQASVVQFVGRKV